jgi:putative PEP-CTERM system TPR-repeat lipoprotein
MVSKSSWLRVILLSAALICVVGCKSQTKEQLYSKGLAEMKKGNPYGAMVFFKNALEKDGNYFDARHELGKAYMTAGKNDLAERELLQTLRQNPAVAEQRLELARVYLQGNKPDQAIQMIAEFERGKGETSESNELKGLAYGQKGDNSNAESSLLRSLKSEPSRTSVKLELASLYSNKPGTGREADARRLIDEVISSDPRNIQAYYLLARLELFSGHRDKAIAVYQKIHELDKSDVQALYKEGLLYIEEGNLNKVQQIAVELSGRSQGKSEAMRLKGILAFYNKNYDEAIPDLQKSIQTRPAPEAYFYLGLCQYDHGELEMALDQFRMVLENNPFSENAKFMEAVILARKQRVDDSIAKLRSLIAVDPDFAMAHNLLGSEYMAKGMYDEGVKELNRAIELDPKIIDAHMKKGIFYLQSGKLKEAESDFAEAINLAPESLTNRMVLASYYVRRHDYSKALDLLSHGLTGKKSDAVLYNNMAVVMFTQNKREEGLKYFQKAKEADPAYVGASFNIAAFYASQNQTERALQEYRDILRRDPRNARALVSMASLLEFQGHDTEAYNRYKEAAQTKNPAAYLALANYLVRKQRQSEALSVLDEAIRVIPRNAAAREAKVQILFRDKQFRKALDICEDISAINPRQGLQLKMTIYMGMKDVQRAQEQARRFITLNPNSAFGHMMLAEIYDSQNDLPRAIEEIKSGIRADGNDVEALLMLGNLCVKKKDFKSAEAAYAETLRKGPDFVPALFAEGAMLEELNKKKEAIEKYQQALQKSENYVPALNNLAFLYVTGYGDPKEGLRLAFLASRAEPANPYVMDTLGYALLKNGRSPEALKLLEKSAVLLPNDPGAQYHLALALKENGMRDRAAAALRKSLSSGEFSEASNARRLLEQLKR